MVNQEQEKAYRRGYYEGWQAAYTAIFDSIESMKPRHEVKQLLRSYLSGDLKNWLQGDVSHTLRPPFLDVV